MLVIFSVELQTINVGGGHDVVTNLLDCDIVRSLNSSHTITFNFRLMPMEKA